MSTGTPVQNRLQAQVERSTIRRDCAFLGIVTALSSIFYIWRIGFYWDDWLLLKIFHFSSDQSAMGLLRALLVQSPDLWSRPVQAIQLAVLYRLFGLEPLGYHVVNIATMAVGLFFFYFVLRSLTGRRLFSLATTVLYGMLPHYSTDRFWYAAFQGNLSMALYFVSLYADLKYAAPGGRASRSSLEHVRRWKVLSLGSLIASAFVYEVFLPFFLLNPLLVALKRNRDAGTSLPWSWPERIASYAANPLLVAAVFFFKTETTVRTPGFGSFGWWLLDNTVRAGLDLTFQSYLINMPRILWFAYTKYASWEAFAIAAALTLVVGIYLLRGGRDSNESNEPLPSRGILAVSAAAGILVAGGSYAYLYSYYQVDSGGNNRVTIAASIGVVLAWTGLAALLGRVLHDRWSTKAFCVLIAVLCGYGCLVNNAAAAFWIDGSEKQQEILSDMKVRFPSPPRGAAIMLTGLCAWTGAKLIFETTWDVTGAMGLLYEDSSLRGEVLRPTDVKIVPHGLQTSIDTVYSFDSLYFYDVQSKQAYRISDEKAASYYVRQAALEDSEGCLTSRFGTGAPAW